MEILNRTKPIKKAASSYTTIEVVQSKYLRENTFFVREEGTQNIFYSICTNTDCQRVTEKLSAELTTKAQNLHPNYLSPTDFEVTEVTHFCSIYNEIKAYYPWRLGGDLASILNERISSTKHFSANDIADILKDCTHGLDHLFNRLGYTCSSISPSQIIRGDRDYSVFDEPFPIKVITNTSGNDIERFYLSPEMFKRKRSVLIDPLGEEKSVVFTLGLILLECCILKRSQRLFGNGMAPQIIKSLLEEYIKEMEIALKYEKKLPIIIRRMLDIEPTNRPSLKEILEYMTILRSPKKVVHFGTDQKVFRFNTSQEVSPGANRQQFIETRPISNRIQIERSPNSKDFGTPCRSPNRQYFPRGVDPLSFNYPGTSLRNSPPRPAIPTAVYASPLRTIIAGARRTFVDQPVQIVGRY